MEWIALSIVVVGFAYLGLRFSEFRRVLKWFGLSTIILVGVVISMVFYEDFRATQRSAMARQLIARNQIELISPTMTISQGSGTIAGKVKNNSAFDLASFQMAVRVSECEKSDCNVIGEDKQVYVSVGVPSNQVRAFTAYASLPGMPIPENFGWIYEVNEVVAELSAN